MNNSNGFKIVFYFLYVLAALFCAGQTYGLFAYNKKLIDPNSTPLLIAIVGIVLVLSFGLLMLVRKFFPGGVWDMSNQQKGAFFLILGFGGLFKLVTMFGPKLISNDLVPIVVGVFSLFFIASLMPGKKTST